MKIDRIAIHDYGPIKKFVLKPGHFVCIFGQNESGKTTIVEAMAYIIFRRNPQGLRYGKPADVVIEILADDRRITLPSRKKIAQLPIGDLAHIMYIEAAESAIFDRSGGEHFWDSLKALLSHMDQDISFTKIDAKIFNAVGLTDRRGEWKEKKQHLVEQETLRKEQLKKYITEMDGIEKQETELTRLVEYHQENQHRLDSIEHMKNYRTYKQLISLYDEYTDLSNQLQVYERYKYEYLNTWQECEAARKSQQRDKDKLETTQREMSELKEEIGTLRKQEKRVQTEGLHACIMRAEDEVRIPSLVYPGIICVAAALLVAFSFVSGFLKVPAFVLFGFSCIFFIFTLYRRHVMLTLVTEKDTALRKAQKVFPDVNSLEEVAERIETMRDETIRKETLLQEKSKLTEHLTQAIEQSRSDQKLSEIRDKTGCAEIADLKQKIDEKRKLENNMSIVHGKLAGMLHEKDDRKWKRMIEKLHQEPPEDDIDITEEEPTRSQIKQVQQKIDKLKSDITIFKETYKAKFGVESEYDAFIEYNTLTNALNNYELEKKAAHAARDILKQMSIEYDKLLETIITGDDSLSDYFHFVSERYIKVEIKKQDFLATDNSNHVYNVNDLSSGARDQLLLCFRIAALKRLYERGSFLILDDAFIFADWNRRSRLVKLLKKYVDEGNQIIYFTSDDHTRDILKEAGAEIVPI
ncbi:MAG: AAA family ATPase [candidate division WOR-3 bacterium]|nr:MAG: AAA family ATPase [candidate division WOR-3 bacterium]